VSYKKWHGPKVSISYLFSLLFTAYTGSAASLFGGVTISKAAFINQNSALSLDDRTEWQDVQILIIDYEISFMSDSVLKRRDKKLKHIGNGNHVFGGFSIIFSGDFHQLEPVCSNDSEYFQVYQVDSGTTASMW
jgi:hypothetical protein